MGTVVGILVMLHRSEVSLNEFQKVGILGPVSRSFRVMRPSTSTQSDLIGILDDVYVL